MARAATPFAAYLSRLQLRRLDAVGEDGRAPSGSIDGCLMFLDASGFTKVARRFEREGHRGAEGLADVLKGYFVPLLEEIDEHGGDVLYFAGDALLVLWSPDELGASDPRDVCARVAACALRVVELAGAIEPPHGARLAFRASVGRGRMDVAEVGGLDGRWMQLVSGAAIADVAGADALTRPGEVVVSRAVADALGGAGPSLAPRGPTAFALKSLRDAPARTANRAVPLSAPGNDEVLRRMHAVVVGRMESGVTGFLAEFRRVSALFVRLAFEEGTGAEAGSLQSAVRCLQEKAARYEGALYQVLEDEKGLGAVLVFGIPGASHENDPVRAARCAMDAIDGLRDLGLRPSAGVATGMVFCGLHGSALRREYALIGSTMIRATRLMQRAASGEVLTDEVTERGARHRVRFEATGHAGLKGFDEPVPVHRAVARVEAPAHERTAGPGGGDLVGRAAELDLLGDRLERLLEERAGSVVVLEGVAGLGKSALVAEFAARARSADFLVGRGAADSLEARTPLFAFRAVVRAWFGVEPQDTVERIHERVRARLERAGESPLLAPLFNGVLGVEIPMSRLVSRMSLQARSEALRNVLLQVAGGLAEERPLVLLLEDGHWMDSASWGLLRDLVEAVPALLAVVATRPLDPSHESGGWLAREERVEWLRLRPLTRDQSAELIRQELGVSEVPAGVIDLVSSRAEGNPFFVGELVRALMDSGTLRVTPEGECTLAADGAASPLPATLEGVITARVDRLAPEVQLTLKVASVLGRDFEEDLLVGVHPSLDDRIGLAGHLRLLADHGLLAGEGPEMSFRHALTREAAYGMLTDGQRTRLHRSTGETLERVRAENLSPYRARLAEHYRLGALPDRAIPHLAAAGEQSLEAYANREAVDFFAEALDLDRELGGGVAGRVDRARWSRLRGEGHFALDEHDEALAAYEHAIAEAGLPPPRGMAAGLAACLPWMVHRRRARRFGRRQVLHGSRKELAMEGLGALREVGTVYLFQGQVGHLIHSTTRAVSVAHRLGVAPHGPEVLATLAGVLHFLGARSAMDVEADVAVELAEAVGLPDTVAATNVIVGMTLTSVGEARRAIAHFERAEAAVRELRAGLWRHRTKFMFGEARTWLGEYDEATRLFAEAAEMASMAELQVEGFSHTFIALMEFRRGDPRAALARLEAEETLPALRRHEVTTSLVCCLGVIADIRLHLGDPAGALEAVRELDASLTSRDDGTGYFAGLIGHASAARVLIDLRRTTTDASTLAEIDGLFASTRRRIRKYARIGGASATLGLIDGRVAWRDGKTAKARRAFRKSRGIALAREQPFEAAQACAALAELERAPDRGEYAAELSRLTARIGVDPNVLIPQEGW